MQGKIKKNRVVPALPTRCLRSSSITAPNPISKQRLRSFIRLKRTRTAKCQARKIKFYKCLNGGLISELVDQSKCECPICIDLTVSPVILDCGHVYCLQCFEETSVYDLRCALCRGTQSSVQPQSCAIVQTLINEFILPRNKGTVNYWCRQGDFQSWDRKRRVDFGQLRIGDLVDIRDDRHIWRRGILKDYCVNVRNESCINVKIKCHSLQTEIELPQNSRRLAKFGFFTKTMYLNERTVDYTLNFVENIQIPEIGWGVEMFLNEQSLRHPEEDEPMSPVGSEGMPELALQLFHHEIGSQLVFGDSN